MWPEDNGAWHVFSRDVFAEMKEHAQKDFEEMKRRLDEQMLYGGWRTREEQERLFRERAEARQRSAHTRCMGCFNRTEYCTCGRARQATRCLFCSNLYAQCTCVQRLSYPQAIDTTCTEEHPTTDIVRFVEDTVGQHLADWQRRLVMQMWAEAQFNKPIDYSRINIV